MIEITSEQIERVNRILSHVPGGAEKALSSVIKRATSTVKAKSTKAISEVYAITPKNIRANSSITVKTETTDGGIVGTVKYAGYKIPLYRFNVSPTRPANHQLVKAATRRDRAPKPFVHAFIAQMKSGHIGVFERKDERRLPIKELPGLSTPQMVKDSVVLEEIEQKAQDTIDKRLEHEIERILNGYGK